MGQSRPIGSDTILIVEDEPLVRFDITAFFEERGWRVFEAEETDEAIRILEKRSDIRVVLTDVAAQGKMSGLKLAHYVRERFPPTILFVASGRDTVPTEELPERTTFLSKPFDLNRVLRQIEGR